MSEAERPDPPLRDSAVDAAWKANSTELPPARVDAAILAAAHREARARPRPVSHTSAEARAPSRAWWGLAAAATIGAIAFGVVQMAPPPMSPEGPVTASDVPATPASERRDSPPMGSSTPAVASDAAPAATSATPADKASPRRELARERQAQSPPPATDKLTAVPAAPAPMPLAGQLSGNVAPAQDSALASATTPAAPRAFPAEQGRKQESDLVARSPEARDRDDARPLAKDSVALSPAAPSPKSMAAPSADTAMGRTNEAPARAEAKRRESSAATATLPPEAWVARIVALMDAGRRDDAARELNAFRNVYTDADGRLPPSLRDWAATVRRDP